MIPAKMKGGEGAKEASPLAQSSAKLHDMLIKCTVWTCRHDPLCAPTLETTTTAAFKAVIAITYTRLATTSARSQQVMGLAHGLVGLIYLSSDRFVQVQENVWTSATVPSAVVVIYMKGGGIL